MSRVRVCFLVLIRVNEQTNKSAFRIKKGEKEIN
jgi:hypothetical protein